MALEAPGATVVPGRRRPVAAAARAHPAARDHGVFGTLSLPGAPRGARARGRARAARARPAPPRHRGRARRRPGRGARARSRRPGARRCADTFGMSDVWSTMAGECEAREGLHLTTDGHALLELVDPGDRRAGRARGRRVRRARVDPPAARGLAAAALPLGRPRARVDRRRARAGATAPRIRIDGRADDMLRVQAVNVHPRRDRRRARALRRPRPPRGRRRRRPDRRRRCASYVEARRRASTASPRRCARRSARASTVQAAGARDAAGGRAEDPHRLPHGARRGAAAA